MKPKYVKCIRGYPDNGRNTDPVAGRIYAVLREGGPYVWIGTNNRDGWNADRFQAVGCPCSVSGCLTHREGFGS